MQVTELESKGLKRSYKITVPQAQVETQMEAQLKEAGEKVKIPGFRPGFIPMNVLKQRYGKSVEADVVRQVINNSTNDLLKERKIRPATQPSINIDEYKEGGDLSFTIALEAFPEVPELKFDKIKLPRHVVEITEADIEDALKRISERTPQVERAKEGSKAKSGNVVIIDFEGSVDGKLFDGGTAKDFRLELGSGQFIEGFEAQLEGAKEGEARQVNVTFPKEYHSQSLAGKPASFAVTVKEIHDKTLPVIDEEFAKARGFADLPALHEAVRTQLVREYDQVIRQQLKKDLFDLLDETYEVELPPSMVEMEFNTIWERLQQAKAEGDESLVGKSDEELKEEYMEIAKRRVKLGIILAETGNRNNIQVTREELGRAVMQQAGQFPGQEKQVLEFYRNHPEHVEDMRGPILEEKAVDLILTKVAFEDKTISAADLLKAEEEGAKPAKGKKAKASKSEAGEDAKKTKAKKKASDE
ncbi:MAG: trigger factor [Rickettsiales bacterium]|nr:trigger factor [Rickettsiales bacterium]